ncbi:MAG: glucans biosynthesis glucosyltransferase MdoH [Nitrosomonadales bacterium]|nr:glucans biosynthesis glucosyltransferase MdoH [Nitrosomonadales bacterium]
MAACIRYVERLPLTPERQREVLARVAERVGAGRRDAVAELHRVLSGNNVEWDGPACGSLRRRLALAVDERAAVTTDVQGRVRLVTAPSLNRSPMAPKQWSRWLKIWPIRMIRDWDKRGRFVSRREGEDNSHPDRKDPWHRAAAWRRTTLLALVLGQTYVAALAMMTVLPYHGQQSLEIAILSLFAILFAWISAGFWTAISGFVLLLRGRDRHAISASAVGDAPIADAARTAIVMPICNEDVARVFAGLRATYESLRRTGELKHFDFFILSDSADPDTRIAETEAWLTMCRDLHAFGHVFYRRRQHRIKRKSGNVADFCRRWGSSYRYMVVVDADSVMSGECLTTLVRLMETNPTAGIIQTAPRASGRETFYARVQQFANRVYGPLFTAGMHFWQLGESHYWGHNAIIRVAPFIRHCALGRLPGRGRFSGEILSHDFVEAALMRRAGWAVWLAYDLPGSWEEMPPNLLDELKRDRRWCLGNLINARLLFAKGLHAAHRVVFATGVMAYFSGLLWFLFLVLSTALLAVHTLVPPEYFVTPNQLFPIWPEWNPAYAVALFSATSALLFLPKVLAGILVIVQGAQRFGGSLRVVASMVIESIFSMLLAPIRMLFHTQFIVSGLIGWTIRWKSPIRTDAETPWLEALRRHGAHTLLGMGWAVGVYALNPSYLTWLLPVVGALMLSIPLSVLSSRVSFGRRLRAARLFLIPEESKPPRELRWTLRAVRRAQPVADFVRAVVDPLTNAVACASSVARTLRQPVQRRERTQLVHEAAATDPEMLTTAQKMALLNDPVALSQLHFEIWTSAGSHPKWLASISAPVRTALTLPHTREHRRPVIASAR